MSCGCNDNKVKTVKVGDVAIDNLASLPDYILAVRSVEDEATGEVKNAIVRVPSNTLFPNASQDNVVGEAINNLAITVPENQVRAGYILQSAVSGNVAHDNGAHFIHSLQLIFGEEV